MKLESNAAFASAFQSPEKCSNEIRLPADLDQNLRRYFSKRSITAFGNVQPIQCKANPKLARGQLTIPSRSGHDHLGHPTWLLTVEELAKYIRTTFQIECEFASDTRTKSCDNKMAFQWCRIAQDATHNAIKRGRPTRLAISLNRHNCDLVMQIQDGGCGIEECNRRWNGTTNHASSEQHGCR